MTVPRKGGRPARGTPAIKRIINISRTLSAEVDILLYDPRLGNIGYGAWSGLVERLLREWVDSQRSQAPAANEPQHGELQP